MPVTRSWPRAFAVAPLVGAVLACLTLLAAVPAGATTLRHAYRFDPARVHVDATGAAAQLRAADMAATWEQGRPEIPYDVLTFVVPQGSQVTGIRVHSLGDVVLADNVVLQPAGDLVNTDGIVTAPKAAPAGIEASALVAAGPGYPNRDAEIAGGGALHGFQLLAVRVYPIHYDAATGRVSAHSALDLEIDLAPGGAMPLQRERYSATIEADAQRTLERLVANPDALSRYERRIGKLTDGHSGGFHPTDAPSLEGSEVEYVIITTDALAASWQIFADWKTRRGVPTVVRTAEWIQTNYRRGVDLQESMRIFIADAYAKWNVRFVLLGGDTDLLPARYGWSNFGEPTERSIPCDAYFACLDGNWNLDGDHIFGEAAVSVSDPGDSTDFYAEVNLGRVTASTTVEVTNYTAKIQSYENPAQTTYQNKVLMLGEVLFPVDWDSGMALSMDGAAFCEEMIGYLNGCNTVTRLYENHWDFPGSLPLTRAATIAHLNAGQGFVNHIGHGYRYNMSCGDQSLQNFDAMALTNGDKRFVLYMLNCTATAFDFPCLAEAFLETTGGAVAVLGASRAAYALPSRNYNRGFMDAMYQLGYSHIGEAFVQSRIAQTPNAWFDTADHYSHLLYNFIGDPELVMHTCNLGATAASYPGSIGLGLTNVTVHVTVGGVARQGALVCLQKGTEEYESALTNASGDAVIPFRAESAGTVQVAVSGQNMTTHLGTLSVTNGGGAYITTQTLTLNDDNVGLSNGNSDGVLDAGEGIEYTVTFVNSGNATGTTLTGKLRIPSPWATVTDSTYNLSNITAGNTGTSTLQVAFAVQSGTPDGTVLPLTFVTTNGSATWTDVVNRVVHAPKMRLTLLDVDDSVTGNGDGLIQAGENFDLIAYYKNYGTGAADGLNSALSSVDPDVVITTAAVAVGRANAMQELAGVTRFRLRETVLAENRLQITLVDNRGRALIVPITLRGPAAPPAPSLDASTGPNVVVGDWTPSIEPDLAGYLVYRALSGSGPWTKVTPDRLERIAYFRNSPLSSSTQYFYRCTAVDSSGNESQPSPNSSINTQPAQLSGWPIGLGASSSCTPVVGDITGDSSKEILAGNNHLYAWNNNGIELRDDDGDPQTWGVFSQEIQTITGALALGEMDRSSPGFEVFATSWDDTNRVYAVRGNGSFLPGWPQNPDPTTPQKGYWGDSAAMDVDGDGRCELWAPAKNGNLYAWHWNGTPLLATAVFKSGIGTFARCAPSFANVDSDPHKEIIYGTPTGVLNIWNADGTNVPNFPKTPGTISYGNTAVGDINKDGIQDVVYLTEGGAINVYNTKTGNQLPGWPKSLSLKNNPKQPSPALCDLNFDGFLEIVVANNALPTSGSAVQVYDYLGNVRPGWPILVGGHTSESSPIVADVSGDGIPDILFGNEGGLIYGWNRDGVNLPGFPLTVGDFIRSVPVADDVDGDGLINLVLTGWDKNVYIWNFTAPYNKNAAQWPMLGHDVQRSGNYKYRIDEPTDVGPGDDVQPAGPPPAAVSLGQNAPNPFNPVTRIEYGIPAGAKVQVRLDIFDASGRRVRQLISGEQGPGMHAAIWDGRDDGGVQVRSGIFFYRLQAGDQTLTRKMVMLK